MALVGEFRYIQELYDKGQLTDQEYANAKAALLKPDAQNVGKEKKPSGSSTAVLVGVAALIIVVVLIIAFNQSTQNIQDGSNSPPVSTSGEWRKGTITNDFFAGSSEKDFVFAAEAARKGDTDGVRAMLLDHR